MEADEPLDQNLPAYAVADAVAAPQRTSRARIIAEFALFGAIYVSDRFVQAITSISWGKVEISLTNLHSNPPSLAILAVILLWINGGLRTLHFSWPENWRRCLWQLGVILILSFVAAEIIGRVTQALWGAAPESTEIKKRMGHPEVRYFFACLIFPIWAVAEEVFYRAYLLQRIEQLARPWRYALPLAVVASSVVFALRHLNYGVQAFPYYVLAGMIYAAIFIYTKRSIWIVSIIHYLKNTALLIWLNVAG